MIAPVKLTTRWTTLLAAAGAMLIVVGASCSSRSNEGAAPSTASDRAAVVEVTGCGFASGSRGSGIGVGEGLVVAPAHVVLQADTVEVAIAGGTHQASIVALNRQKDLALLQVGEVSLTPIAFGAVVAGDRATLIGGGTSGSLPVRVIERVTLTIEEALGTDRYERLGYKLEVAASGGDSGAGIYDGSDRLVGMLFAVQGDIGIAWATASEEIAVLLEAERSLYVCEDEQSFISESTALVGDSLDGALTALGHGVPGVAYLPIHRKYRSANR